MGNRPDNTRHSQETDINAPGETQTRSPSKREAADPLLRSRGHWYSKYTSIDSFLCLI
jgi:hypothetical protein